MPSEMENPGSAEAYADAKSQKRKKLIWIIVGLAALYFFVLKK